MTRRRYVPAMIVAEELIIGDVIEVSLEEPGRWGKIRKIEPENAGEQHFFLTVELSDGTVVTWRVAAWWPIEVMEQERTEGRWRPK